MALSFLCRRPHHPGHWIGPARNISLRLSTASNGSLARKVTASDFSRTIPLPAEVLIFPFVTDRALRQTRPMRTIQLIGKPNRDRISSRATPRTSEPLWPKNSSEWRGRCEPLREKHSATVRSKKRPGRASAKTTNQRQKPLKSVADLCCPDCADLAFSTIPSTIAFCVCAWQPFLLYLRRHAEWKWANERRLDEE